MVEQLTAPSVSGAGNLNRAIRWNIRRGQQDVIPGSLNPSLCQCAADGEQYTLHDSGDVIYIASMMLWNEVFSTLQLRTVVADGRFKQIPPELNPTRTSQLYTIIVDFNAGHTFPLLYAFLPDGREETYYNMFRTQIEPLGGVAATGADHCNFLTDFELPAINSIRAIMDVNYHACLFHYMQCILRNRDSHQLRRECSKTAAVAVLQKATSTASACDAVPRYF